jgi:putative membrane protein
MQTDPDCCDDRMTLALLIENPSGGKMSKRFLVCAIFAGFVSLAIAQQMGLLSSSGSSNQSSNHPMSAHSMSAQSMSAARSSSVLSASDRRFIKEAAEGGMAEVELGRLAQLKGSSDDVKKFGQRMVEDHTKANDKLKELAASKSITLPEKPNPQQEATKDRLVKLAGAEFDKAYMKDMVQDHKNDVAAFRTESRSGHDPEVKDFATQTLPTVSDHLKNAQNIAPKVPQALGATESSPGSQR